MNKLEIEELAKVTGGHEIPYTPNVIVTYKDTDDGILQDKELGDVVPPEQKAKDWCKDNNKIYVDYRIGTGSTVSYDTQVLLDNLQTRI